MGWKMFHLKEQGSDQASNASRPVRLATLEKPAPAARLRLPESDSGEAGQAIASGPRSLLSNDPLELGILLKSKDLIQRRNVAKALHGLGVEASQAAGALRVALKDTDEEVQMWAALALINCQQYDKQAVPILVHVLHNENSVLRQVACLSLGLVPYEGLEKDAVVPALAETAGKDIDEEVRKAARSALNIIAPDLYNTGGAK